MSQTVLIVKRRKPSSSSLLLCADALKGSDTTLVIEPLNRKESNIVNSVGEGVRFAKAVNRPEIRVLADIYHMDEENEPLAEVATHVEWLSHIHLADTGRFNPGTGSYDYDSFFRYLKAANYRGMFSVECTVKNPETDMRLSHGFLRQHWPSAEVCERSALFARSFGRRSARAALLPDHDARSLDWMNMISFRFQGEAKPDIEDTRQRLTEVADLLSALHDS